MHSQSRWSPRPFGRRDPWQSIQRNTLRNAGKSDRWSIALGRASGLPGTYDTGVASGELLLMVRYVVSPAITESPTSPMIRAAVLARRPVTTHSLHSSESVCEVVQRRWYFGHQL